jgi:hypothetical protein
MPEIVPRLKSNLPKGLSNSLPYETNDISKDPKRTRVAVVLFDVNHVVDRLDGTSELHFRLLRWETVHDDTDLLAVRDIVQAAGERRSGQHPLPEEMLDVESGAFDAALERKYERDEAVGE